MTRAITVLRPEPGNAATIARLRAAGQTAISLPLFRVMPLAWHPPDPAAFDRLLLTSANAVRHGGDGLAALQALPVIAVGSATAAAARAAQFSIDMTGSGDLAELLPRIPPGLRLLWLSGEDRTAIDHPSIVRTMPVYRAGAVPLAADRIEALAGGVALLHSARAADRLARLADLHGVPRNRIRIAAISAKAAAAAGLGWAGIAIAAAPNDEALIAAAMPLAIDP